MNGTATDSIARRRRFVLGAVRLGLAGGIAAGLAVLVGSARGECSYDGPCAACGLLRRCGSPRAAEARRAGGADPSDPASQPRAAG